MNDPFATIRYSLPYSKTGEATGVGVGPLHTIASHINVSVGAFTPNIGTVTAINVKTNANANVALSFFTSNTTIFFSNGTYLRWYGKKIPLF